MNILGFDLVLSTIPISILMMCFQLSYTFNIGSEIALQFFLPFSFSSYTRLGCLSRNAIDKCSNEIS
jgi:hypothetical protein